MSRFIILIVVDSRLSIVRGKLKNPDTFAALDTHYSAVFWSILFIIAVKNGLFYAIVKLINMNDQ